MRQPRCEIFRDGEWYGWRLIGANGTTIAESPRPYTTKRRAQAGVLAVLQTAFMLYAHLGSGLDPWRDARRWFREV